MMATWISYTGTGAMAGTMAAMMAVVAASQSRHRPIKPGAGGASANRRAMWSVARRNSGRRRERHRLRRGCMHTTTSSMLWRPFCGLAQHSSVLCHPLQIRHPVGRRRGPSSSAAGPTGAIRNVGRRARSITRGHPKGSHANRGRPHSCPSSSLMLRGRGASTNRRGRTPRSATGRR